MIAEFVSSKPVVMNEVGRLDPGIPVQLDGRQIRRLQRIQGQKLGELRLPKHVQLTVII